MSRDVVSEAIQLQRRKTSLPYYRQLIAKLAPSLSYINNYVNECK